MRSILRAILALALLLGSGLGDWAPAAEAAHETCCCGTPASTGDACPCPKPEGNRTPSQSQCVSSATAATVMATRRTQVQRRTEPRPEPASWALASGLGESAPDSVPAHGRDPDLGRHLAQLSTLRI